MHTLHLTGKNQSSCANALIGTAIVFAAFILFLVFAGRSAQGQYAYIVEHKSEGILCGSPGAAGCPLLPTCIGPNGNELRDDYWVHEVLCDLPGSAEWGGNKSSTTPLILQQYQARQYTPGDTPLHQHRPPLRQILGQRRRPRKPLDPDEPVR